jgi:ribosomal protein S18 acetylase RimI-like enzyme
MLKAPEPAQGLKARNNASVRNRNKPRRAGSGGNLSRIQFAVGAPSDWQELIALVRAYYRFDDIRFKAATVGPALKRLLEDESLGRAWIIRDGVHLAGYAILTFNYDVEFGGVEGIVTDLFIHAPYRGLGIGRQVMALIDGYCRLAGIHALELQVEKDNGDAQEFYRRLGFKTLSRLVMSRAVK